MAEAKLNDALTIDDAVKWLQRKERMVLLHDRALIGLLSRLPASGQALTQGMPDAERLTLRNVMLPRQRCKSRKLKLSGARRATRAAVGASFLQSLRLEPATRKAAPLPDTAAI